MAVKKPLGYYGGRLKLFQAGDFMPVSAGGTGGNSQATAQVALGLELGVNVQAYSTELAGIAVLAGTGFAARTGAGTYSRRAIAGAAGRVSVTNGDGVSGAPVVDLDTVTPGSSGTTFSKVAFDTYGRIGNIAPVVANDISFLVDTVYGRKDGATFTGPLSVSSNAANPLEVVPLQQLTSAIGGITSGATGGGGDRVFIENDTYITTSYRLGSGDMKVVGISLTDPAVFTMPNTFVENQPIQLDTTGVLPSPLDKTEQYFVLSAGLSGSTFQISLVKNGAPISTSGSSQSGIHKAGKIKNALTTGPITAAASAVVSGPRGSRWIGQ